MRLERTSLLPCSVAKLAPELARPVLLHHISWPMLTFTAVQPDTFPGLVWHDAGYSDLIKVWDHKIRLADLDGRTRYTDEVEIRAGLLTVPAWLFAWAYYTHRQRRLNRLVASGFEY